MIKILFGFLFLINTSFAFDLALDVGHNIKSFGTTSSTCVKEYTYNLELTKYLISNLSNNKNFNIESNIDNSKTTFKERYELSNNKDLFISIHHDSTQKQFIDYKNKCPQTDYASGFSIFVSKKNIDFEKSFNYAKKFATSLINLGLKPTLHHNENIKGENRELLDEKLGIYLFDDLLVLKNSKSPAFLFEAGVIVNPIDEKKVRTEIFKNKIVESIKNLRG